MPVPEPITDAQAIINAGQALSEIRYPRADAGPVVPYCVVPQATEIATLEQLLPAPARTRCTVVLHEAASLVAYVTRHETAATVLYANEEQARIEAVIDHHEPGKPAHGDHRALLTLPVTPAWQAWTAADGKIMTQTDFAGFIEDRRRDISHPPAADMLEIASSLRVTRNSEFISDTRLSDGQTQLSYSEIQAAQTRRSSLVVPELFTVAIPIFQAAVAVAIECRLRYRLDAGKLSLSYRIVEKAETKAAQFRLVVGEIAAAITAPVLFGDAPRQTLIAIE